MARSPCFVHAIFVVVAVVVGGSHGFSQDSPIFEQDVQPILAEKCGKCHSDKVRKGGLNLTSFAALRRGGESGESPVAESLDDSLMWILIDGGDMPPEGRPRLSAAEKEVIRQWIASGAASKHGASDEPQVTQHDVLPILLLRCSTCHGPQRQDGKLDLSTLTSMHQGGQNGPALIKGNPDGSPMIQRIESEACPPRNLLLKFFVRRPPKSEVLILRNWIAAGAPEFDIQPDVATTEPDPMVTDEDRRHWAFQPPRFDSADDVRQTVDDFIEHRLDEHQLTFSPEASRDALIRRVYLDLIGMPPSIAEWKKWRSAESTDWYAQMVDHLLDSPHYGERWARYWLDVAGYADSEGGVSADPLRAVAWKYRDYVIRAFNDDKPYDRFLLEQIAGDELLDYESAGAGEVTQEMVDNLVATGFLRMGIDQTGSRTMNFVPERIGVISDAISVLGSGVMGLTLECARCHSHKYDPIPHRDYYRFKAILQGALDEHDWLTFRNRSLALGLKEQRQLIAEVNPALLAQEKKFKSQLNRATTDLRLKLLASRYPEQSDADRQATLRALTIADNNRTLPQRILVEKLQRAEVAPDSEQSPAAIAARREVERLESEIVRVQGQMAPPLTIRALWDRGRPSPTYVLRRGEHDKPGTLVGPGVPSALTDGKTPFVVEPPYPGARKTGRRLALAKWLTSPDHPLTARVMVNRVWRHHFGVGLVRSLENFGVKGDRPSHPQLLDWLAIRFVEDGWSVKQLHRTILNSRTYRQTIRVSDRQMALDPQNRWLSRMPMRRMDAEALRDSLLFVSGRLDARRGGRPDPVLVDRDGLVNVRPTDKGEWRRSIYLQYRRTELPTIMETFDYPEMGPNCVNRNVSIVSPQALMLMNNHHVHELAEAMAQRVQDIADVHDLRQQTSSLAPVVDVVYQLALTREPEDRERDLGVAALRQLLTLQPEDAKGQQALATYCHTILNSAAFLFVD